MAAELKTRLDQRDEKLRELFEQRERREMMERLALLQSATTER